MKLLSVQEKTQNKIIGILWAIMFFLLPITSFPLLSRLAGGTMVAPPSMVILFFLLLIWFLPAVLRGEKLPKHILPLMAFVLAAVFSSLLSMFLPTPPFRNATVFKSILEGIVTLCIGASFYILTAAWFRDPKRLSAALRWINWSGVIILVWSFTQAVFWKMNLHWPGWLRSTQEIFSSGTLFAGRVVGFAFEPSWLIHQLNMLYLPFWLAATLNNTSAHSWRIWKFKLENFLLVLGAIALFLAKSRIGLLAFLLTIGFFCLELSFRVIRWLNRKVSGKGLQILITIGFYAALVILAVSTLLGIGHWFAQTDYRMKTLFDLTTLREKSLVEWAEPLSFAARIVYWQAGWEIFNDHPLLGVGLSNAGFYFPEKLSNFSWKLMEVRDYMYRFSAPPNIKSTWVRLLAETGILGFSLWTIWYLLLWFSARFLYKQKDSQMRTIGLAGCFVLVCFLLEGFSIDSFALPYFWVATGLFTAAFCLKAGKEEELPEQEKALN